MSPSILITISKAVFGLAKVFPKKRLPVLVIEDREQDADVIMGHLKELGFASQWARTPAEAMLILSVAKFHVAFLDLRFDVGHGVETYYAIAIKHPLQPVIWMTGEPGDLSQVQPGCYTFISKGIEAASLHKSIERALAKVDGLNGRHNSTGLVFITWLLFTFSGFVGYLLCHLQHNKLLLHP